MCSVHRHILIQLVKLFITTSNTDKIGIRRLPIPQFFFGFQCRLYKENISSMDDRVNPSKRITVKKPEDLLTCFPIKALHLLGNLRENWAGKLGAIFY